MAADSVFRTRSLGTAAEGVRDQYADGKAARVWEVFVGDKNSRTDHYRKFLLDLLRKNGCKKIFDVACGTGIDSVLLVEEGFQVTSADASDKMLKYALKTRWNRRKEPGFDDWVIEEANWLTLPEDVISPDGGFDALLCLGNSFAHLPDAHGDQRDQKLALQNFAKLVKPGGILLVDHRNYDHMIDTGHTPTNTLYYNSKHTKEIKTSVLLTNGKPSLVTLDYTLDVPGIGPDDNHFRLSYHPHRLEAFSKMVRDTFGPKAKHSVYGDFTPLDKCTEPPAFYIHVVQKPPK